MASTPHLWLRKRGNGARYYIKHGERCFTTGFDEGDEAQAEAVLQDYLEAVAVYPAEGATLADVPLSQVLLAALARSTPLPGAPRRVRARHRTLARTIRTLDRFWDRLTVGQVDQPRFDNYLRWRTRQERAGCIGAPAPGRVALGTARAELSALVQAIRGFARVHGFGIPVLPRIGRALPGGVRPLTRGEVARLLWAACGFDRDPATGEWSRGRSRAVKSARRAQRRHLARFILISIYTGSTAGCVSRLRWREQEEERSFVDVGGGLLHRLGEDEAPANLAGVPITMCRRIVAHLARWERLDGGRFETVVHHPAFPELAGPPSEGFRNLRMAAGLPEDVGLATLRETTGAWLMRSGCPDRAAAGMLGMKASTFLRLYRAYAPNLNAEALRALEAMPWTVRSRAGAPNRGGNRGGEAVAPPRARRKPGA